MEAALVNKNINLINPQDIETYLKKFSNGDAYHEKLLAITLVKIIKKSPRYMETLNALPADAPPWLIQKWSLSSEWHKFNPRSDVKLPGTIFAVAEWLDKAITYELDWLKNVDDQGRPKKLLKISKIEEVWSLMNDDEKIIKDKMREAAREELQHESLGSDVSEIMKFENGYRIVKLMTERALDRESAFLEHCVGDGYYDKALENNTLYYYSLRTADNQPRVTFSVDPATASVRELSGFRNNLPDMKYMRYIATFAYRYYLDMSVALTYREGFGDPASWDVELYPHLDAVSGDGDDATT